MAKKKFEAYNFLVSKIGNFNSYHPFREDNIDYEDIINWLDEYAKEYHENEMKKLNWSKIFIEYIDQCTNFYLQSENPKDVKIEMSETQLFNWFKERIMRDLLLNKKD